LKNEKRINVALVGLGFGSAFISTYLRHPNVGEFTICDTDPEKLARLAREFGVQRTAASLEAVLADRSIDAVHLNTGIPDHARQSIAIMEAGKHCGCTVPMATTLDDIRAVIAARRRTGRTYMMMETQFYAREFLYARELQARGTFGKLQLLRGAHYQDMENWPAYWQGLPPMWYATHAIAPCLAIANTRAVSVRCLGSGEMRPELRARYGNPFPIETALFKLDREVPLVMEITRALFHSARGYTESFNIYGEDATLEAPQLHKEAPVLFRLPPLGGQPGPRRAQAERVELPDYGHRLPPEIAELTGAAKADGRGEHFSVAHGGAHGGSHPHLVHEFVRSLVEGRAPAIDELLGARWCAPGICAHQSAMQQGAEVLIPDFA
jgi:predicted dehydrogenase